MNIRYPFALFPTALAVATGLVLAAGPTRSEAAFPGLNGKIAYSASGHIHSINSDGSERTQLTSSGSDYTPAWSPDGQKIAFKSGRDGDNEIFVMNADGSGQTNLTNNDISFEGSPTWSPDGLKIVYERYGEIYVMNANGTGHTRLYYDNNDTGQNDEDPAWSPVAWKIAFERRGDIYVMNGDGSGKTRLTYATVSDDRPAWSPDGQRIVFSRQLSDGNREIYVMNANGSGQTNLTNNAAMDDGPAWSPDGQRITFERDQQLYVMNADGSAAAPVPGGVGHGPSTDWQRLFPPLPPPPEVRTVYPGSATIEAGTLRSGSVTSLRADDNLYFEVNSTPVGKMTETRWFGSVAVANELASLKLGYRGKNSRVCTQQLELRDFDTGNWVVLDNRTVGTTEVEIVVGTAKGLPSLPPAALGRFVSGTSGKGELHFRVRTGCDASFVSSGELMQVVYSLP